MSHSPLDPDEVPESAEEDLKGHGVRSLGPSDSSDTGADWVGLGRANDTSDRQGTGERASVENEAEQSREGADIDADRVVDSDEAGLGGGLDQAEEAQLGITDEEIDALLDNDPGL